MVDGGKIFHANAGDPHREKVLRGHGYQTKTGKIPQTGGLLAAAFEPVEPTPFNLGLINSMSAGRKYVGGFPPSSLEVEGAGPCN